VCPDAPARSITRRFLRWSVAGALLAVALAYGTAIGWLMANEVQLVFVPNRTASPVAEAVAAHIERVPRTLPGGAPGLLWVMRQAERPHAPWVLYLHGNGANLSTPENVERYDHLRTLGLQVVTPEYPGFGALEGTPSEATLGAAARDAWAWLREMGVPASSVALYGWSLGSGVATDLASTVDEHAVVLEGAFTGVDDRARELYPWMPIGLMIRNPFASRARIAHIGSQLLLLHARDDTIIPFAHGERLLQAARQPKRLVALAGGHIHPHIRDEATYLGALREFFGEAFGPALVPLPQGVISRGQPARRGRVRR